jgi:uncharacterized protein (TIGR00730 family)
MLSRPSTPPGLSREIRSIAVFCGSNTGKGEAYLQATQTLGKAIGERGLTLVYGGTNKGLMGVIADAAQAAGGKVHGVITRRLVDKGHLRAGLDASEIVADMRIRKARMADLADAFIALPGGIGTLEEFMEIWTLNQLGILDKPAGLLDVNGYYQPLMRFIDHMIAENFLPATHRDGIVLDPEPAMLIDRLRSFERVLTPKWM